jgi:hypothetical protein
LLPHRAQRINADSARDHDPRSARLASPASRRAPGRPIRSPMRSSSPIAVTAATMPSARHRGSIHSPRGHWWFEHEERRPAPRRRDGRPATRRKSRRRRCLQGCCKRPGRSGSERGPRGRCRAGRIAAVSPSSRSSDCEALESVPERQRDEHRSAYSRLLRSLMAAIPSARRLCADRPEPTRGFHGQPSAGSEPRLGSAQTLRDGFGVEPTR